MTATIFTLPSWARYFFCSLGFLGMVSAQPLDLSLFNNMKARSVGPAGMSGRVTAIDVVKSDPQIIYVGTASGGLWKSESGGIAWKPIFDQERVASIGALSIYQNNPDIIWAGTGEGNPRNSQTSGAGVYRSLDGGRHWQLMGLENTRNIHRVLIHPQNPDIVYVGAQGSAWGPHPERGVYKTTDGGKNWQQILSLNDTTGVADMVMDPQNPNKLLVAMWQFQRWPWFFKSGGAGSGLYMTHDGGETWQQRTDKHGLPKGELGRIGLAIAQNNPNVIYALVESKKNALYRSNDGGFKWRMVNNGNDIGNRPFYYSDIFVDPTNENRIYSLHSMISRSEDGGKSFQVIVPYSGVHPDHHAFYIHPENPRFLINGNDGGVAISRDMGDNWRFVENLPLAQYYHINIDNQRPYNIYGGMQDNGSWRGPAYIWRAGGIRNSYWEELFFGDGFDVVPHPTDARYGYAMSQGGYLGRIDFVTGNSKFIRPVHPEGTDLRFNWNAAIAQDPFDANTIYYGSQFVHKSTDRGENWQLLSPDLTTNDPEKQKQLESGGLTYDVTQAENHTSIVSIAPSPVDRNVVWVGTDDGNLQLTLDGGQTWNNLIDRLTEVPAGSWIPQIHASNHEAGEAFVVVNNYRRNDWTPYVYRTDNFGQSWQRLTDADEVWGYALSIVQDPIAPNLLFLGTEFGLYVSIDRGANWQKWTHGYPTVSTMDMKIHPQEHDLVIGTFGRAAYVLDDIRPLREIAQSNGEILAKAFHTFEAPDAVQVDYRQAAGTRFAADAMFSGENRTYGAMLSFFVKLPEPKTEEAEKPEEEETAAAEEAEENPRMRGGKGPKSGLDTVKVEILTAQREIIRTLKFPADTGLNRVYWRLDRKGPRFPRMGGGGRGFGGGNRGEPSGGPVLPGTYLARMTYGEHMDSTEVKVMLDPRLEADPSHLEASIALSDSRNELIGLLSASVERLTEAQKTLKQAQSLMPKDKEDEALKALQKEAKVIGDSIKSMITEVRGNPDVQGIRRDPKQLMSLIFSTSGYLSLNTDPPNSTQKLVLEQATQKMQAFVDKVNGFFETKWTDFREKVEALELSPFEDYEPVTIDQN